MLPVHFGTWQTVYGWFRELARRFLFQTIHDVALMVDRERAGREARPLYWNIGRAFVGGVTVRHDIDIGINFQKRRRTVFPFLASFP